MLNGGAKEAVWRPFGGGSCKSICVSEMCVWGLLNSVYRKKFLGISSNGNRKDALI